jgi:hypothetical protein
VTVELARAARPAAAPPGGARSTPAPSPAASSPSRFRGPLAIESRPPGASVFLNGKLIGKTPLMLSDVTAGSHAIRLELEGYRRWTSAIRVVAGEKNRVTASLER